MQFFTGLLILACLIGAAGPAQAADTTTVGTVVVRPGLATKDAGNVTLSVKIPYTGDDTTPNNTALIEWDESGGDWSTLLGSASLTHSASPYTYDITGLDNSIIYQVRVTILDTDGVSGSAVQTFTGLKPYDALIHNSVSTGSTKHSGNWGLADTDSKYGQFTCSTCHSAATTNIKRIKLSFDTPDGSDWVGVVANSVSVNFTSASEGSSDFGDDSTTHDTSDKVCEVCHSATAYHNYNQGSTTDHYNQGDCVTCHKHKNGFKASCDTCHGGGTLGSFGGNFWPDNSTTNLENDEPARHKVHMDALSQLKFGYNSTELLDQSDYQSKQVDLCGYCHDNPGSGSAHNDGDTDTAYHPLWSKATADSDASLAANSCSNIDCHNNKETGTGTWGWATDTGTSTCSMCHTDVTTSGTHLKHLDAADTFGVTITCDNCHAGADFDGNIKPTDDHLNGEWNFTGITAYTVSYPTHNGSCGTNDCHEDGQGGAPADDTYTWGQELDDCTICHAAVPSGGSHDAHVDTAETSYGGGTDWAGNKSTSDSYDFGCGNCHGSTLANHLDNDTDVAGVGYSSGTCTASYCHSNGQATPVYTDSPAWGGSFTGDKCAGCHLNSPDTNAHQEHEVGFHYNAIYSGLSDFLPVSDTDAYNVNLDDGDGDYTNNDPTASGFDQLRGHGGNLLSDGTATSTTITCNVCHNSTVTSSANARNTTCATCHDYTLDDAANGDAALTIADKSIHVDGTRDVLFFNEKLRSKAQVRDGLIYNSATPTSDWTDIEELSQSWVRYNGYKANDGSSYDESPDTLYNTGIFDNGSGSNGGTADNPTCLVSCHLTNQTISDDNLDKEPAGWADGGQMCSDCHTLLPQ